MTCVGCGCALERGEGLRCLRCAIELNRRAEAIGCGQLACRDCKNVWSVEYDDEDQAINHEACPECDSSAFEPLSVAQHRAELAMEGGW